MSVGPWPDGSLLARLGEQDRGELLGMGTLVQFGVGDVLLLEGDEGTHVLLLRDGVVKITATTETGAAALLAIRVGGDVIGELAAVDPAPRVATATAAGAVVANRIAGQAFRDYLAARPAAALAVSSVITSKLRWATKRRIDFSGHDVLARSARVIIELADTYGRDAGGVREISVALTQPELAGIIGAKEPSVHRALTVLRRDGLIETKYRRLVVRDMDGLYRIAKFR